MKYSIVIPTYTINKDLEDMAITAILSYRNYFDEIIVCEDGGNYSKYLFDLASVYIYNKQNVGFTANVNRGWRYSDADFTAIVSSDTALIEGNPRELCIKNHVTSPEIANQNIDLMAGPFFVVPKEVRQERGLLIEEMRTYCSDSEYEQRIKDIFVRVPTVRILHHQAQTVKAAGVEGGAEQEKDRTIYHKLRQEGKAK